jgi:crotonobetainyl-CoA:carnitine CoA-transferase CaiB-like acyl-CoA transferase
MQYRPLLSVEAQDAEPRRGLLTYLGDARKEGRFLDDAKREYEGYTPTGQPAVATNPYYSIYRARDSYVVVACLNNRLRRAAAGLLGVDDPRLRSNEWDSTALPIAEQEALRRQIEARFATRTAQEWCSDFDAAGIPCGPVRGGEELFDDPHARQQGLILDLDHPLFGTIKMPNLPVRFSDSETGATTAAPVLGQHTRGFLRELGYGDDEVQRLVDAGVVRARD